MNRDNKDNIVIYEDKNGDVELRTDAEKDTIWATQDQVAQLFSIDQSVVSRHVKNIFADREIEEKSNMQKMHIANADRPTILYSLDIILAVGYRTSSHKAILFRRWATGILRKYLTKGHALNKRRLESSPTSLIGLYEAVTLLESLNKQGTLKGKFTLKLTENLVPRGYGK